MTNESRDRSKIMAVVVSVKIEPYKRSILMAEIMRLIRDARKDERQKTISEYNKR